MRKKTKSAGRIWKVNFLNILKPNTLKIFLTIVLLLTLPVYPCKTGAVCESKDGADCTQLEMNFFTLLAVKDMQNPFCVYSLLYFPIILTLVYVLVAMVVFVIRKKK